MEQIVTHPLYIRGRKVIESCETNDQLKVAIKYCNLVRNRMLLESLVEGAKWNLMKCEESTMKH